MQRMINDLLSYSRVYTKEQPFTQIDLNQVVREVLHDLEIRIQDSNGQVELGELPVVEADPTQMRQLMQNLISNALKFHKPRVAPVVKVDARQLSSELVEICVEDNGIGFKEQFLDRIFQPFQRLHGRSSYEGNGIGLAICRKIAERHSGSITAKSAPGKGTQFFVTLPAKQANGKVKRRSEE
jgi:light-regulated signal transduction histidine kinase (bacteriophytochrome)